jgi:hypothetical protein
VNHDEYLKRSEELGKLRDKFYDENDKLKEMAIQNYSDAVSFAEYMLKLDNSLLASLTDSDSQYNTIPSSWLRHTMLRWVNVWVQNVIVEGSVERTDMEISMARLVEESKEDKMLYLLIEAICAECFKRHCVPPISAYTWLGEHLSGEITAPTSKGPASMKNNSRDTSIYHTISYLKSLNILSLTRNDASASISIFDAVGEGFGMSYKNISDIYYAQRKGRRH